MFDMEDLSHLQNGILKKTRKGVLGYKLSVLERGHNHIEYYMKQIIAWNEEGSVTP